MHFIDKNVRFMGRTFKKNYIFKPKNQTTMDNYLITVGMYLILMLFFKIYFAVAAKD